MTTFSDSLSTEAKILRCSAVNTVLHLMLPIPGQASSWCRTWSLRWRKLRSQRTCWCRSWCSTRWWSPWRERSERLGTKTSAIREDVQSLVCSFLLVNIIVVSVVAAQCDERAQAESVGKEDLSRCVQPHLTTEQVQYVPRFSPVCLWTSMCD